MKPTKSILILLSLFLMLSCETPVESDTTPPGVIVTFPVEGSYVSEIVNITCLSTDNVGVSHVELWIDGISTGNRDSTESYSFLWNTTIYDDSSYHNISIRSYDTSGNKTDSEPIVLIVDNTNSYPETININSIEFNNGSFYIVWNKSNDGDFQSYQIEKSIEPLMNDYEVIYTTQDITDTSYVDSNIDPLLYQYYRVGIIDTLNYETKGDIISSSLDLIPNVTLSNVSYTHDSLIVEWTICNDGDFRDYKVLLSETEDGDKDTVITISDSLIISYSTNEFDPTKENWYWIMVSDTLNQSSISNGMTNTIDSPPSGVYITSVEYNLTNLTVSWNKSSDSDFSSYILYYSDTEGGNKDTISIYTEINTISHSITNFDPTKENWYWIEVIDIWGLKNISGGMTNTIDSPPSQVDIISVEYDHEVGSFGVKWLQNIEYDFQSYKLYQSFNQNMSDNTLILESTTSTDTVISIENIVYGENRYYQLLITDIWGQNTFSEIVQGDSFPKIVSIRSTSGDGYLYRVNIDGTDNIMLDNNVNIGYNQRRIHRSPKFYDNGKKIVYVSGTNLNVMDLDGSNKIRIDNIFDNGYGGSTSHDNLISYKFNDELILFNNNEQKIYSMSLDGSNLTTFLEYSNLGSGIGKPIISQDGQKVLYSKETFSNGTYYHYLYIVNIDGSNNTQIVEIGGSPHELNFTPDGNQIIWTSYGYVSGEISLMKIDVDGSNQTQIVGVVNGGPLSISNNGNKIIFEKENNLWIVDIDGNNLNQLTNDDNFDMKNCQFSKNDEKILYDKTGGVYIMNIDGSNNIQLSDWDGWTYLSVIQPIP